MEQKSASIGKRIGNYRIKREIGSGGFGNIYLAEHVFVQQRIVVIKLLRNVYLGSEEERQGFLREAQILDKLKEHPHILSILDMGIDEGVPYLITAYAEQGSLRDHLKLRNSQPFPVPEALTIIQQVGAALQYAHDLNVVHRDMKPENILFNSKGEALLADFGISTLLSTASAKHTEITGTPAYMAPEQFRGEISKRSDQYALACIAYELLSGHRPFGAGDFISLGFKHVTEPPRPIRQFNADISIPTEQALLRAMAKARTERFENITAFVQALTQIDGQQYTSLPPDVQEQPLVSLSTAIMTPPAYLDHTTQIVVDTPASNTRSHELHSDRLDTGNAPFPPTQTRAAIPHALDGKWRLIAALSYLTSIVGWFAYSITDRNNRFLRYHVLQSFIIWIIIYILITGVVAVSEAGEVVPIVIISLLLSIATAYMLCGFVASLFGKYLRIPLISSLARRYADRRQPDK